MADQETPTGIKQLIQSMAPEAPSVKEGIVTSMHTKIVGKHA